MGCSGSREQIGNGQMCETIVNSKLEKLVRSKRADDLLLAFLYLEKSISEEESESPPSVYGEALSRQQQIKSLLQLAYDDKNHNEFFSEECSFREVFIDLGVSNSKLAAEHEEFIARINRRALNKQAIKIWQKALDIVENQIEKSFKRIKSLQDAYYYQEKLLSRIFGRSYENEAEKSLEKEVDRMRYYRDMLYIGVLQWEACLERIACARRFAKEGVDAWDQIKNQPSLEEKIKLTTIARNSLLEAILLIQAAEELLTDVQFPFCTTRELKGVVQALDYVFTDILIDDRYLHATEIYKNLLQRTALLDNWMRELPESDGPHDVRQHFRRLMESKKMKMCPSRRIDELRNVLNTEQ